MANEDLLVTVGVDDSSLLGGFARDVQAARGFASDLAKAATVNFVPPRVDLTAFRAAGATAGAALADGVSGTVGGANGALASLRANLAELTRTAGELQIGTASNGDVEALRQLVIDQRRLAEATAGARSEFAALDLALQTLNEDANGNAASLRTVQTLLGDVAAAAQRVAALGPIGVTLAGSTSGVSAARAEADAAAVQRAAAAETAARQQASAEVTRSIGTLRLYGTTVDAVNERAVAGWREEAAAIRAQANELALPREAMLRLDATIQQVERRFASAQAAAARLTGPTVGTNSGMAALVKDTGAFSALGTRAGNAAVAVAFGLEAVATSAGNADSGLRTALRAIASLGVAFGPEGLLVSGLAAGAAAIIDLFDQTEKASKHAAEAAAHDFAAIANTINSGDFIALQTRLQQVQLGTRAANGQDGLFAIRKQFEEASAFLTAHPLQIVTEFQLAKGIGGVTADSPLGKEIARQQALVARLRPEVLRLAADETRLADALINPPDEIRAPRGLPAVRIDGAGPKTVTRALRLETAQAERDLERFLAAAKRRMEAAPIVLTADFSTIAAKPITIPITLDQARVDDAFVGFDQHVAALKRAADQIDLAKLVGDPVTIRIATEVYGEASVAADAAATSFAKAAAALSPEALAAALARIHKELGDVKVAVPLPAVHEFSSTLRAIGTGTRGVLQLADAFGHVNTAVRQAFDGVAGLLSGLADASDALRDLRKTNPSAGIGDLFGSASGLASIIGVVGGLASFAQGFLSLADRGPSPEEVARDALLKSNTEEMARLRDEYRGAGRNAPTARELLRLVNPATGPNVSRTAIDFREVERVAKELGLTLALIDSAGNANAAAFALLRVAAAEAAAQLLKLSDSFDAQRKQAELGRRLAGEVSTPAVQTAADLGIFTALAPHFAALFQGVDAATADGRRIIREGLKHIFQDVVAGRLTLEDLGGIANVDDLFTILGTVADDLDLFDQGLTAATDALGNVPVAFKAAIDAFRFNATRPITATPTPTPLSPPTTPLTPRVPALTTAGTTAPITVHYYAVNVEAGAVTTTEQSGDAILASVDRAVVQRARATGGVNHTAANGIVAALGRIGRA